MIWGLGLGRQGQPVVCDSSDGSLGEAMLGEMGSSMLESAAHRGLLVVHLCRIRDNGGVGLIIFEGLLVQCVCASEKARMVKW